MTIKGYPTHTLVYWRNETSGQLVKAVWSFFGDEGLNKGYIDLIRDYIMHWLKFRGHAFEKENDRQNLIKQLEKAQSKEDLTNITNDLLKYGIDPF